MLIGVFLISVNRNGFRHTANKFTVEQNISETLSDTVDCLSPSSTISKVRGMADSLNLIDIADIDRTIGVKLMYATPNNFTGKILYEDVDAAYLQQDVALMLAEAHRRLKEFRPDLRLLVYDAARPLHVQRMMWECVKDTKYRRYVADPDKAGLHNYGAAVDLTLADSLLHPLDMGTDFDYFGKAAGITNEQQLLEEGLLKENQIQNRQLLRQVMLQAGFRSVGGEWWHFNACSLNEAKQRYPLIERF